MEWQLPLVLILGGAIALMLSGMPVAFAFLIVSCIGAFVLFGGEVGLGLLVVSIRESITHFYLLPIPLFVLMGELLFHSNMAPNLIMALDKWIGRIPGRLGLLGIGGGTLFATLTGTSLASTALLGELLVPEMEKRGYKKSMSLGPILGSGGLALMIPPSSLAVLLGALAEISIGRMLIGIIIPGLLMALLYVIYTVGRCWLQPSLAPAYEVPPIPLSEKVADTAKYILPVGIIIFLVTGLIIIGFASPTEAAATGALGTMILVACYRKLNWQVVKKSLSGTVDVTVMVFMIIAAAGIFTQVLAVSAATHGAIKWVLSLPLSPILVLIAMQVVLFFMGMFMSVVAIMMITVPLFMPVVYALGFDPVWFGVLFLLNIEMATTSPPFGLALFVMKGVAPPDTTMQDCSLAALPYLLCDAVAMALMIAFPPLVLWLPGLIR